MSWNMFWNVTEHVQTDVPIVPDPEYVPKYPEIMSRNMFQNILDHVPKYPEIMSRNMIQNILDHVPEHVPKVNAS